MRAISFAWTTPSLVTRNKTCTRRDWNPEYAARFLKGDRCAAYDKQARFGGKPVGVIRLTDVPRLTGELPEADFAAEGFEFDKRHGLKVDSLDVDVLWRAWRIQAANQGKRWWVVRFEVVEINEYGLAIAGAYAEAPPGPLL